MRILSPQAVNWLVTDVNKQLGFIYICKINIDITTFFSYLFVTFFLFNIIIIEEEETLNIDFTKRLHAFKAKVVIWSIKDLKILGSSISFWKFWLINSNNFNLSLSISSLEKSIKNSKTFVNTLIKGNLFNSFDNSSWSLIKLSILLLFSWHLSESFLFPIYI